MKKKNWRRLVSCLLMLVVFLNTQMSALAVGGEGVEEVIMIEGVEHTFNCIEDGNSITTRVVGPEKTYQGVFDKSMNMLAVYILIMHSLHIA